MRNVGNSGVFGVRVHRSQSGLPFDSFVVGRLDHCRDGHVADRHTFCCRLGVVRFVDSVGLGLLFGVILVGVIRFVGRRSEHNVGHH